MTKEKIKKISYRVVTDVGGDTPYKDIDVVEAAEHIFKLGKEQAMQPTANGVFISFDTVEELAVKLADAFDSGKKIKVYDENIGG